MEQFLKEQIKITLSGDKEINYFVKLYNNQFVIRWLKELKNIISSNLVLEKNYCFIGFADTKRNLSFLCKELNLAITQINQFNNSGKWQKANLKSYKIEKFFEPTDFMYSETLPIGKAVDGDESKTPGCRLKHDACNKLHRYFEDLQGQAWNLSEYYHVSDDKTKYAIRQLNNLCHEIEGWVNAYRKSKFEPEWMRPSQITTFLHAPRKELLDNDYDLFVENRYNRELGGVYLHWSQIGKTLYEVWRDHDESVGESGITHQKLYSGEFDVEWGQTITDKHEFKKTELQNFQKWLKENGYNWNNKKLALGYIKLGQVDLQKSFNTENFLDIYKTLVDNLNIAQIEIFDSKQNVKNSYPYTLDNDNYKKLQLDLLKKGYNHNAK